MSSYRSHRRTTRAEPVPGPMAGSDRPAGRREQAADPSLLHNALRAPIVGLFLAAVSAATSFTWPPYHPVWSIIIIIIAISVTVIPGPHQHGRDFAED